MYPLYRLFEWGKMDSYVCFETIIIFNISKLGVYLIKGNIS